jgi:sugar lactone lactonase YvrE
LDPDGQLEILDEFDHYVNGIGLSPTGRILTAEEYGLKWLDSDGTRQWLSSDCGLVDGFAFDVEGNVYACNPLMSRVAIISVDGTVVDSISVPRDASITNCCFGGGDLRTLFVTDAGRGVLLAISNMPVAGLPLKEFRVSGEFD